MQSGNHPTLDHGDVRHITGLSGKPIGEECVVVVIWHLLNEPEDPKLDPCVGQHRHTLAFRHSEHFYDVE